MSRRNAAKFVDVEPGIPQRLRAVRALADLTVEQLADKMNLPGLGAKTLGAIERGERDLRPHELPVIAAACDVPPEFFTADISAALGAYHLDDRSFDETRALAQQT